MRRNDVLHDACGIDPAEFYPFDQFCRRLGLLCVAQGCLLDALHLSGQNQHFMAFGRQTVVLQGAYGLLTLSQIGKQVNAAARRFRRDRRKDARRKARAIGAVAQR